MRLRLARHLAKYLLHICATMHILHVKFQIDSTLMKRIHLHVNTTAQTFDEAIDFYSTLYGTKPTKHKHGYAKWMLDDPKLNFVIEVLPDHETTAGIHHVGIQVDSSEELNDIKTALNAADAPLLEVGKTTCCYSESEKNWTVDPSGVRWETFHTTGDVADYGTKTAEELHNY